MMKSISKIVAMIMAVVMMLSLVACQTTSSKSLTMNIETGDSIEVKLDTSEGLSMKWDKDEDVMKISEDDDVVLKMIFANEDHIQEYTADAAGEVNVKDAGKNGKIKYSLFTPKDEDDENHYIVGWIVGSDTGIIAKGTDSKSATMNAFESLSFSIEDTDQDDEDYYLECVIMEEDENTNEEAQPDDDKTDSFDEDEEAEPTKDGADSSDEDKEVDAESDGKDNQDVQASKVSKDWKDYEFSIDGNVLKLPVSYKELKEATGYSIKSAEEKSYLEPDYYTSVQLRDADGNGICYIDVFNNTDEDAAYVDCVIIQISQDEFHLDDAAAIEFAGGLHVGDTTSKDELIAMFGEPTDIHEYRVDETEEGYEGWDKYETDTYTWSEYEDWTTMNRIKIEMNINTGIIESIDIDHSAFED